MAATIKPTLNTPTPQGKKFQSNFNKTMTKYAPDVHLTENVDGMLSEAEQSLKKKIFSLAKMEALVFSDPKLSAVYEEMAENGEEKYGYHYNETIQNMIFNDYVLNSPKYLQKYKQAIPKEKKRRDQSGINQLKKAGEETMAAKSGLAKKDTVTQSGLPKQEEKPEVTENDEEFVHDEPNYDEDCFIQSDGWKNTVSCGGKVIGSFVEDDDAYNAVKQWKAKNNFFPNTWFVSDHGNISLVDDDGNMIRESTGAGGAGGAGAFSGSGQYSAPLGYDKKVDETTGSASSGQYSGPAVWGSGDLMKTTGKAKVKSVPMVKGGTIIDESKNYLTDPSDFEKFVQSLNEEDLSYQIELGQDYKQSHSASNNGLGVSEVPQNPERDALKKGIDDNTSLYIGQDVDKMRDDDVKILHNDMTQNNTMFPHPDNPNLPDDGISGLNPMTQTQSKTKPFVAVGNVERDKVNDFVVDKTNAFTSNAIKGWNDNDMDIELDTLETGDPDKANLTTMEENINEVAKSKAQQRLFGMAHAVQKGELSPNKVGGAVKKIAKTVSADDVEDFASTKHDKLPEKIKEETQTMIQNNGSSMSNKAQATGDQSANMDMGTRTAGGGVSESYETLLEEINNELNAFSIHHDKLKRMSEDRKPSALVLRDRVGSENEKNFKSDLKDSSVSKIVDIENALEFNDQQTKVGDPQKLGQDIEKQAIKTGDMKSGEALKNVGNSANEDGDEIPKRNLSDEEQEEVNMYRLGLGDYVYDNEVGKRFEERMKADMGDKLYELRQKKLKFRAKAPMYNKDTQPTEAGETKVQFDKANSGWNEREGIKEGFVTAKYNDSLGKKRILGFNMNEVWEVKPEAAKFLTELNLEGMGNTYTQKVSVNESVVKAISKFKFYTNGVEAFAMKVPAQSLNESKTEKPAINEQMEKMKHLVGYNTMDFVKQSKIIK